MDNTVIDELFEEDENTTVLRHSEEELKEILSKSRECAASLMERIGTLKAELSELQDSLRSQADELEDLYDDLDFSQQTLAGGTAEGISDQADEFASAAENINEAIDVLSDMLLFRFK
ncbi:MAG: hypothetical protein J6X66_00450 [Lachnospiraceae bacterium]|nr:hypothetical protein [Lachnospiraceae bacterium]